MPNGKCPKCECLLELYEQTDKSPRNYWLMTELFVLLHDGDVCNFDKEILNAVKL